MQKRDLLPEDVPEDVQLVLAAFGRALNGRGPTPELAVELAASYAAVVPKHVVTLTHRPRTPKGTRPALRAVYILTIQGPRIDGRWAFSTPQITALTRLG